MSDLNFSLFHKGVRVNFTPTDLAAVPGQLNTVARIIDAALAAGWSASGGEAAGVNADGKERRQVVITGWVYGKSQNGIPLVWLYSDNFPYLTHKAATVYNERIKELPGIVIPKELKPLKGIAPDKKSAIDDGDYHRCEPFTIELTDTGEQFEGHPIFSFTRVVDGKEAQKPAPVVNLDVAAQTRPAAAPEAKAVTSATTAPATASVAPTTEQLEIAALSLAEFERLGQELFGDNWPATKVAKIRSVTRNAEMTPDKLTGVQLDGLLRHLRSLKAKPKVTPPPQQAALAQ